jgi:hypothetical protein
MVNGGLIKRFCELWLTLPSAALAPVAEGFNVGGDIHNVVISSPSSGTIGVGNSRDHFGLRATAET